MKKITVLLVALLLLCSCGGKNYDESGEFPPERWDLPPEKLFDVLEEGSAEERNKRITFVAENNEEYEIEYNLRFRFQKQEEEGWVVIEPLNKLEIIKEFVLAGGEKFEITFDFEDIFGMLKNGNYRIVVTSLSDGEYRNQWYEHYYFKIEKPQSETEELKVFAEAGNCDNIDIHAKIFNESEKEVFILEYFELFYETEKGFEKFDTVRGVNFGDSRSKILPGESIDKYYRTGGTHGERPIGRYKVNYFIEYEENGKTVEQTVPFEFEITGFEESSIVPLWDRTTELFGSVIKIIFRNGFNYDVRYGDDYYIQKFEGESWKTVETEDTPAFDTVLWNTKEGGTAEWTADLSLIYGELPKGNYHIVKSFFTDNDNYENGEHICFFEFTIE